MSIIAAAPYCPDAADIYGNCSGDVLNMLPSQNGYTPMAAMVPYSHAFKEATLGGFAVRLNGEESFIFVGTKEKLYRLNSLTLDWDDASGGKKYHATSEAVWSFASFGHYVIAVNENDAPQVFEIGKATHFRDLGSDEKGKPPRAGIVKIWGDFVCLMGLPDNPRRVHWSGLNDCDFWKVGERSCDFQDFAEGERVQGSNEAPDPIIFMESAIYRGQFIPGSALIFSFKKIATRRGAKASSAIASRGDLSFFVDEGGFFQIDGQGVLTPIGFERVDKSFFAAITAINLAQMRAITDPFFTRVYFAYSGQNLGHYSNMLIYDWALQQWSMVEIAAKDIIPLYMPGMTLEGLDKVGMHLEKLPFSLDSKVWQGGTALLGAFDLEGRVGFFNGHNMEALYTSQELCVEGGNMQFVEEVLPLIDTQNCALAIARRFVRDKSQPLLWGNFAFPSKHTGRIHKRARGRFLQFKLRIAQGAQWKHFKGFDVGFKASGRR